MRKFLGLSLAFALLLAGCQTTDPDSTTDTLTVDLSTTDPTTIKTGDVNLTVTVSGGQSDKVEILENDTTIATLSIQTLDAEPYSYTWSSEGKDPGDYKLKARATKDDKAFDSTELTITVEEADTTPAPDTTAPQVTSQSPPDGATDIAVGTDASVTFDEAIDTTNLADKVKVTDKDARELTAVSSFDTTTNTLNIDIQEIVEGPNTLTVTLTDIADAAGNILTTTSWSWSLVAPPATTARPTGFSEITPAPDDTITNDDVGESPISVAANSAGTKAVAWVSDGKIAVSWRDGDDTAWTPLTGLPVDAKKDSLPSIALLPTGNPVVAWRNGEDDPATTSIVEASDILVYRWTGTAWESLGVADTLAEASAPSLALDGSTILVAFHESDGVEGSGKPDVMVKKYNGTGWEAVGGALDSEASAIAIAPSLAVANDGTLNVAWREVSSGIGTIYVKQFNGSSWESLGGAISNGNGNMASLTVDINNLPVITWQETDNSAPDTDPIKHRILVKRWNGVSWEALGAALDSDTFSGAQYPQIAVDTTNIISVVWNERASGFDEDNLLAQWRDGSWETIGQVDSDTPDLTFAYSPDIAIGADNAPVIAWFETPGTGYDAKVAEAK